MAEQNEEFIAERVRHHLKDAHPGGITLEVVEDQIWRDEYGGNVPVQPDFEPKRLFEYYETLADIEIALRDNEDLKVYFVPGTAKADLEPQPA